MQDIDRRFELMRDAHSKLVYNFLWRFLGDADDASDALAETFRRAYRGLNSLREEGCERAWLMTIASNVARRAKPKRRRESHASLESMSGDDAAPELATSDCFERVVLNEMEARRLLAMLQPLPREAVWMRVGLQLTDEEVGIALGVPTGTVKSWVWRSMVHLRKACDLEGGVTCG